MSVERFIALYRDGKVLKTYPKTPTREHPPVRVESTVQTHTEELNHFVYLLSRIQKSRSVSAIFKNSSNANHYILKITKPGSDQYHHFIKIKDSVFLAAMQRMPKP